MVHTNRDVAQVATTNDEPLIISNVSDDALERAAGADDIAGGRFSLVFATNVEGDCGCPV